MFGNYIVDFTGCDSPCGSGTVCSTMHFSVGDSPIQSVNGVSIGIVQTMAT